MALVSWDALFKGVSTRGPAERPCSSASALSHSSGLVLHGAFSGPRTCSARARVQHLASPGTRTASTQTAPPTKSFQGSSLVMTLPEDSSQLQQDVNGQQGPRARVVVSYEEDSGDYANAQQAQRGTGVLKINVDLLLWRCRTDRIKARATLDLAERKQLMRRAEEGLRRCIALDRSDARSYVVLGKLLLLQKRFDEARALFQEGCTNTGNSNPYIWSSWGWLEYKTKNFDRARKLFDAATVVDPTHACAWHKWGTLEKEQGNYTRARDLWMQGIQRCRRKPQSQNAYLYNALGVMAAQLGRVGEARAWFEEGTRTAEGAASVALWQAWAVLEAKQGDPSAVRYLFKKSLSANPRSRYTHLAWALWERKLGNYQACIMLLKRGCSLNPTDAALYQAWALVERDMGRIDHARALFERGLRADPGHLPIWQAWGIMEAELRNPDRARQLFQEGVWADPQARSTTYIFHAWGCLEARLGNYSTARELFKAALKVDPKNEVVWSSWITMEEELGNQAAGQELRIRQAEQQWEFVVPAGFTTRPEASPLSGLADTLARFFRLRGEGASASDAPAASSTASASSNGATATASASGDPAAAAAAAAAARSRGELASLLPSDFRSDLTVDMVMRQLEDPSMSNLPEMAPGYDDGMEASAMAAISVSAAAAAASTSSSGSDRNVLDASSSRRQQQQPQQRQQPQQQFGQQQQPQRQSAASATSAFSRKPQAPSRTNSLPASAAPTPKASAAAAANGASSHTPSSPAQAQQVTTGAARGAPRTSQQQQQQPTAEAPDLPVLSVDFLDGDGDGSVFMQLGEDGWTSDDPASADAVAFLEPGGSSAAPFNATTSPQQRAKPTAVVLVPKPGRRRGLGRARVSGGSGSVSSVSLSGMGEGDV